MENVSEKICEWLTAHPLFSINGMCTNIGINTANFMKCKAAKKIPEKYQDKIIAVITEYGFSKMVFFSHPAEGATGNDFSNLWKATTPSSLEGKKGNFWADEKKDKVIFEPNENGKYEVAGKPVTITLTEKNHFVKMLTPVEQPIDKYGNMPPTPEGLKKQKSSIDKRQYPLEDFGKQIEAIKAEKIPKERDTKLGRMSWQAEQQKRITQLQNKLNERQNS